MNKQEFIKAYNLEACDKEFIDAYYLWNVCTGDKVKKCLLKQVAKIMQDDECFLSDIKDCYADKSDIELKKILKYYIKNTLNYCFFDDYFCPLLEARDCNNFNLWYKAKAYGYEYYFRVDDIYEVFSNYVLEDYNEIKNNKNIDYYKNECECLVM